MKSASVRTGSIGWRSRRGLILAVAAGLACAAASCDRESSGSRALDEASRILSSLNPEGVSQFHAVDRPALGATDKVPDADDKYKVEKYNQVIALLKPFSGGTEGESAAAAILLCQAQTGLAAQPNAAAAAREQDAVNYITMIRSALSERQERLALAAAAAAYSAASEVAAIDKESAEKDTQIKSQQQKKAAIEKETADLLARSKAKASEAMVQRREEAAKRQEAATVSATMAEQILKDAMTFRRQADALEAEAALLDAQAAKVSPGALEVQNTIDRLVKQKELLGVARAGLVRRQEAAKKESAESSAEGAKIAQEIAGLTKDLAELRSGPLKQWTDKAVQGYTQATASARSAVNVNRSGAQLAIGAASQATGDLHWTHAEGTRLYAALLNSLAAAEPPLPGAADYKAQAAEATAETEASLKAALEAYQAAIAAYQAAGGNEQAKAAIERLTKRIADAVYATSSGAVDVRSESSEEPAEKADGESGGAPVAAGGVDLSTPAGTLQAQIDAVKERRWADLAGLYSATDPGVKSLIQAQMTMLPGIMALEEACRQKFGSGLGGGAGGQNVLDPTAIENMTAADFTITESGDTATASRSGMPDTAFRKVGGKWLIDADASVKATGIDPAMLAAAVPMMGGMGKTFEAVAAEVKAGKYADLEAVKAALQQKLLQSMQPPPGGGG